MATWSLYFNNTSNNANNNVKDYPPSEPNTVDTHPYPINPNHPNNPNYKPNNRNSISNMMRNAKSTMSYNRGESNMESKQIGFNSTQTNESEMIKGIIQDTIKPLEKMFNKLKSKVEEMDDDSDERGFAKVTSKGLEGKELFKMLPKLGKKAVKILKEKPPKTWKKYLEDDEPDFESIYEMEVKELCEAMKEGKESVDRELTHVMAALFGMLMEECCEDD